MTRPEKGCVYFFRHIGLSPIKIGYSINESPINRFEQFKTYAPFGAELLGFIKTEKAKELETELHKKFARDRIKGEWFEISKEEAEKCISFYSNIEDIEEMNMFQIAWANRFKKIDENFKIYLDLFSKNYSNELLENYIEVKKTTNDLCDELFVTKEVLRKILRHFNIKSKALKIDSKTVSGYILYKKQ